MLKRTFFISTLTMIPALLVSTLLMAETVEQPKTNVQTTSKDKVEQVIPPVTTATSEQTSESTVDDNLFAPVPIKPLTQAEIREGLNKMQKWMIASIEEWGKTLKPEDFERTWTGGRQLTKPKRQEVCGIYQRIVNETYRMANDNKLRLSAADQAALKDRNSFIQSLGYKNNIIDTQMGFNCRLK